MKKRLRRVFTSAICTIVVICLFAIPTLNSVSAQPTEEWVARYDGPASGGDYASEIILGSSGNIYVTGNGKWNMIGGRDYLTIAYDSSGNELWIARYDGLASLEDGAVRIALDSSGNVYVTGFSDMSGTSYWNITTIAYDPSGNELWVANYDGPEHGIDIATSIETGPSGNIYIIGSSQGNGTHSDFATIAYDPSGNELWVMRYDGGINSNDQPSDIAVDTSGNVYVTGRSWYNDTMWDVITIKYSSGLAPELMLDIDPDTLNLNSKGRWITAYLTTEKARAEDIDTSSLLLNDVVGPERWDTQNEMTLMVKFDRATVQAILPISNAADIKITGQWKDGETFEVHDIIRVIDVGGHRASPWAIHSREGLSSNLRIGLGASSARMEIERLQTSLSEENPVSAIPADPGRGERLPHYSSKVRSPESCLYRASSIAFSLI